MLTRERLMELLTYEPATGLFRWRVAVGGVVAASIAGTNNGGYTMIAIDRKVYSAHRLAWLYVHGTLPAGQIDHINRVGTDNRIANLRDVTATENGWNKVNPQANNTTGYRGVYRRRMRNGRVLYRAKIQASGREVFLGLFETPEEASAAYQAAKKELHRI